MKTRYVIAVSGGVDSVVLLHKLMSVKPPKVAYIVAHFDHGIRPDSSADADFVQKLAVGHAAEFIVERKELGPNASEDAARQARYDFLRSVKSRYKAEAIITAHHQNDVVETMILHMLRGTGPRGLVGYTHPDIIRPFIDKTKEELLEYAKKHRLEWREDATNDDDQYMRNYVRKHLAARLSKQHVAELLDIRADLMERYTEIDSLAKKFLVQIAKRKAFVRSQFVILPFVVQKEIVANTLRLEGVELTKSVVERMTLGIKTLPLDKHIELKKGVKLYSKHDVVLLKVESQSV